MHDGEEHVVVLQGTVTEEGGRRATSGETLVSPAGSGHSLRIESDEECIVAILRMRTP